MIRVIIAEDQALIRESFSRLIQAQQDMSVVAAVDNGRAAVDNAAGADVVVMDIRMPIMDGIEATRAIMQQVRNPKVLVLTTFKEEDLVLGALDAGAAGFLLKDSDPATFLDAIRRVAKGEGVIDPKVTPMVLRHLDSGASASTTAAVTEDFTAREAEVLRLVCQGLSNDKIAARLVVAPTTVKTHVKNLLTKTGTTNRVGLVIWAAKRGLV